MNKNEFDLVVTELKSAYGESKYPEVRLEEFFKRFSILSQESFRNGIKNIIANDDKAPMAQRIAQELRDELNKAEKMRVNDLKSRNNCSRCGNNGYILHPTGMADIVSQCTCELRVLWPAYPKLNEILLS